VLYRYIHVEPLRLRLLPRDNDVDSVPTSEAMTGDVEKGIGVRREVYAHDIRFLVHHKINEPRILMAEVVLPPDMGHEQIV